MSWRGPWESSTARPQRQVPVAQAKPLFHMACRSHAATASAGKAVLRSEWEPQTDPINFTETFQELEWVISQQVNTILQSI